jgi:predicted TIM-barrel fold metal-dependent hydrolase
VTKPDAEQVLTQAVKDGAQGFGEMKFHVGADGPELRRTYALAADLRVPILIHFQEVDHFPNEGTWSTGFAQTFESILKAYPRTTFIGHADAFWANVSADFLNEAAYPTGPIKRGGVTDKWLGDYPNLFGDLSANSGNNAMSRDPQFTADFLKRVMSHRRPTARGTAPFSCCDIDSRRDRRVGSPDGVRGRDWLIGSPRATFRGLPG